MSKIVGIDLGTTNSLIAIVKNGKPLVISDIDGALLIPSVVGYSPSDRMLVGKEAKDQRILYPQKTIYSIKRRMGEKVRISLGSHEFTPEEISSFILKKLKDNAERFLSEKIEKAVITVPAYFDDRQRQATKKAGELAGLEVVRIINEPTASSLAYGLDRDPSPHTVMVWDLGGGTFDVSILEIGNGVFEVKATSGDTHLGGDDWDERLFSYLEEKIGKEFGKDVLSNPSLRARLLVSCEKTKCLLSKEEKAVINQPISCEGEKYFKNFKYEITRQEFEDLTKDLFERLLLPTKRALSDAKLFPTDIDRIIMVGGSSRMPKVRELAQKAMGKIPYTEVNPDEVVALGAALQAAIISQEMTGMVLLDVTPLSLGIETQGGIFTKVIDRNTPIPTSQSKIFTTAEDNQTTFDIHILQGEREIAVYNQSLGKFTLENMSPAPKGEVKTEVVFTIDINGILHVSAQDLQTGEERKLSLKTLKDITEQEIEFILSEAKRYVSQDQKEKNLKELCIKAESLIYATEKMIEDLRGKLPSNFIEEARTLISSLKQTLLNASNDREIEQKVLDLREKVNTAYEGYRKQELKSHHA